MTLSLALFAPPTTLGAFTRPFVRQITGTPTGPGGSTVPFKEPRSLAVDAQNNVWVGERIEKLDEFNSAGSFMKSLELTFPTPELKASSTQLQSLAIDDSNENFYVAGERREAGSGVEAFDNTGKLLKKWQGFGGSPDIVIDNSADPLDPSRCALSVCTAYVGHEGSNPGPPFGNEQRPGVEKFSVNASGEPTPASFTGSAPYIKGNEIIGTPAGNFDGRGKLVIVVDSEGNVYVAAAIEIEERFEPPEAVYEYSPSGLFVHEFSGAGTPDVSKKGIVGSGFGGYEETIYGLTVDPISHHLLVALQGEVKGERIGAIDEFDSSGAFLNQITEIEVSPGLRRQLGDVSQIASDSTGAVSVVDTSESAVDVFGPGHFLPSLTLAEPTTRLRSSAVVGGSFNPEGEPPSECSFEYVSEAAFKTTGFSDLSSGGKTSCEPAANTIPADSTFHAVQGDLTGLASGTTYRYRLSAATSGALGGVSRTEPLAFTAPSAPRVDSTSASNISSGFADLRALVDPLGADTSYYFEYGPTSAYGNDAPALTQAAPHGVDIGSGGPTGSAEVSVVQQVGGLTPGTAYHFRVVAESEVEGKIEISPGPDSTFATLSLSGEGLPDGRAYELLTPPNKGSAEDMFEHNEAERNEFNNPDVGYPSESGKEFLLETRAAFGSFAASGQNAYVFRRSEKEKGWQTLPLASPALGVQSVVPNVFDPADFSRMGLFDISGSEAGPEGIQNLSLFGPPGGPYVKVQSEAGSVNEGVEAAVRFAGASRDLSRIILQTSDPVLLAKGQDAGSHALYELAGGELTLASVNPEGAPFRCGAWLGQSQIKGSRHNAVSADGSRVILTAPDPSLLNNAENKHPGCWNGGSGNVPQLYMRLGGATIQVSAAEAGVSDPTGRHAAVYVGASEDGSKVFFVTEAELTKDDVGLHEPELYECEIVEEAEEHKCKLTRISAGEPGSPVREPGSAGAKVLTVPAISADGSVLYFTALGRLTSNAPAVEGNEVNLYRYDVSAGTTAYVATVDTRDYPQSGAAWSPVGIKVELALATEASWETTADGRYLLFASTSELKNGYSTAQAAAGDCPVLDSQKSSQFGHCTEVYRYDSANGSIYCISCDPSGASPVSDAFFAHSAAGAAPAAGPVRAMSADGSYAFFDTADPLVPQDGNGTLDVYEWEAQGRGGCQLVQGCVHLISSGQDSAPSYFLGASVDGSNVFFGTHARLVPRDTDNAGDLYDARIGGGFGAEGGVGPCEGDACQNPPPAPVDATPGSLTFSGGGNATGEAGARVLPKKKVGSSAAQLAKALKACRHKPKSARKRCKAQARKRYAKKASGPVRARHASSGGRTGR
jgi:hypothetical protein